MSCDGKTPGEKKSDHGRCMVTRREFLLYSGATAATASTISISLLPGSAHAEQQKARVVGYPRKLIAKLSELKDNQPVNFNYPDDLANSQCMLVKMGGGSCRWRYRFETGHCCL